MKIITTIEATTDAEQAEVAKLIAQLTGVTATSQTIGAKTASPVLDLVDPSVFSNTEQVRHQIRATVHRLVQDGYRDQVRSALDLFGVQKISEVSSDQLAACLDTLSGIGQEDV